MARYNQQSIRYILSNYWQLKQGHIPDDTGKAMAGHNLAQRSPYETAAIWCADFDKAFDRLDENHRGRWIKASAEITEQRLEQIVFRLSRKQQTIARYYLCPKKYRVEGLKWLNIAMGLLGKYMNGDGEASKP